MRQQARPRRNLVTAEPAPTPGPGAADGRFQVFVIGPNDLLRTAAGAVRIFDSYQAAQEAVAEHGGFIQPAGTPPPGGFDRTF